MPSPKRRPYICSVDSRRQQKIASLIQESFTGIMSREGLGVQAGAMLTLTGVKVTPDLSVARFYFSIFNSPDKEATLRQISERKSEWRRKLGDELRFHLRKIPELEFYSDETLEQASRIEEIFREINKPKD